MIDEGKIVTSETTVELLRDAMGRCEGKAFLIDGFPRSISNLRAFEVPPPRGAPRHSRAPRPRAPATPPR